MAYKNLSIFAGKFSYSFARGLNGRYSVVQIINLPASFELFRNSCLYGLPGSGQHKSLYRKAARRGSFYRAYIFEAGHREIKGPGYGSRRQRKNIQLGSHAFKFFFLFHPESLFLIYYEESEILKVNIFLYDSVSAYYQIDFSFF